MQINSNIYAFLSGILVSLSTNIFAALCFKPLNLVYQWHHYLSTLLLVASGALCMYISVKVSVFQKFIANKQIAEQTEIREIIEDTTEEHKRMWVICYSLFICLMIVGFALLGLNWVIGNRFQ
jgi:hypothetical protein